MTSATTFGKLLIVFLIFLVLVQIHASALKCISDDTTVNEKSKHTRACVNNDDGCQPDGSLGNCCSGYCHKEPEWMVGYCE